MLVESLVGVLNMALSKAVQCMFCFCTSDFISVVAIRFSTGVASLIKRGKATKEMYGK